MAAFDDLLTDLRRRLATLENNIKQAHRAIDALEELYRRGMDRGELIDLWEFDRRLRAAGIGLMHPFRAKDVPERLQIGQHAYIVRTEAEAYIERTVRARQEKAEQRARARAAKEAQPKRKPGRPRKVLP